MRKQIRFLLGHEFRELSDVDPTLSVLEYLRRSEKRCGAKEGCAEGDCGACTVVLAEPGKDGGLSYRAVNSCIQFVSALNAKQLITVEDLLGADGALHPVQKAMCDCHASQCGFCTPGFVMSLFANWRNGLCEDRAALKDCLAGNLCRCTGYGPILQAGETLAGKQTPDEFSARAKTTIDTLNKMRDGESAVLEGNGKRCFLPQSGDELAALYQEHPEACIIAGITDVGLWVTKQHRELPLLIQISGISDLNVIAETGSKVRIGAAVTLNDAHQVLAKHFPAMDQLMRRFGARQIRNVGTLCANIANGSPIGDIPPALIALGARLCLRRGQVRREIELEDFFIDYGKQDLAPGEFIEAVTIAYLSPGDRFTCYKLSKRFNQDISAVMAAFNICVRNNIVTSARICYAGMAQTPKRARACEQALSGKVWSEETVRSAMAAMCEDYTPITDMRASAKYRMKAAQNLLLRAYLNDVGDGKGAPCIMETDHG